MFLAGFFDKGVGFFVLVGDGRRSLFSGCKVFHSKYVMVYVLAGFV